MFLNKIAFEGYCSLFEMVKKNKKSVIFRNLKVRKKRSAFAIHKKSSTLHTGTFVFYNIDMKLRLIILLYLKYNSSGTYVSFY